jgi:DNA-binding protein HU-beta
MNKAGLVSAMAKDAGITKGQAERALNCLQNAVLDAIRKGEKVTLPGFGTFSSVQRKARMARNPQTGSEIKIPSKHAPKFAPGIQLRQAVQLGSRRSRRTKLARDEGGDVTGGLLGGLAGIYRKYL